MNVLCDQETVVFLAERLRGSRGQNGVAPRELRARMLPILADWVAQISEGETR